MNAPEAPVREGDMLAGKYRVERVLGVGGMGVVVAALHIELDQRVALKFLLPAAAAKPAIVTRFSREARAAAKIRSEHVVRVMDVGMLDDGLPYIVMEYLEGTDLSHELVNRGALPIPLAVDYILQVCEALAEAHAAGIVHRDLKPANLFLATRADGSEIIKVLDFGISKANVAGTDLLPASEAALTKTADVFGSPMYMSPEQLKSSRSVDARADLWALGVILFELVTNKSPFERGTIAEIFGAILHEDPPGLCSVLPEAPVELEQVIVKCLAREADHRYANVAMLAQALMAFAPRASRQSVERASRVMRLSGVAIESLAPPPDDDEDGGRMPSIPSAPRPYASRPSIPSAPTPGSVRSADAGAATNLALQRAVSIPSLDHLDGVPKPGSGLRAIAIAVAAVALVASAAFALTRQAHLRPVAVEPPASHAASLATLSPPPPSVASAVDPTPSAVIAVVPAAPTASAAASAPHRWGKLPSHPSATPTAGANTPPKVEDPNGFGDRK